MSCMLEDLKGRMDPIPAGRYLIGISGGADSVALLLMLLGDIRSGRISAEAVHVNHGLRGEESDRDEVFVRALCEKERIPFTAFHPDLKDRKDENSARKARYACFDKRMKETGADALLLAHHADDQAETVLMHLLRGSGPDGMSGMTYSSRVHGFTVLRPMLKLRREEIREALRNAGAAWCEDATNQDETYLRNQIRRQLIPEMERIAPDSVSKINRTAQASAEDNRLLNHEAEQLLKAFSRGDLLDAEEVRRQPPALKKRILRMWWRTLQPGREERELNAVQTNELSALVDKESGKLNLPGGLHAVRGKRYLHMTGRKEETIPPVKCNGTEIRFGNYMLKLSASEGNPGDGIMEQEVPDGFTDGCEIRTRRPGDRIKPFGSAGSRKLQDYFTDRHIDEPFRDRVPLLCRGNEVLIAGGVGAGNVPVWHENEAHVRLVWTGEMPWSEQENQTEESI